MLLNLQGDFNMKTYVMYEPTHASSFIDAKEKGVLGIVTVPDNVHIADVKSIIRAANEYLTVGIVRTHYEEV